MSIDDDRHFEGLDNRSGLLRLGSVLRMATGRIARIIRMPDTQPYYKVQFDMDPKDINKSRLMEMNQASFTPEAVLCSPSVIREVLA